MIHGALLGAALVGHVAVDRAVSLRRVAVSAVPLAVAVGLVMAPNYLLHRELVLSRSADLFALAHLVHEGLAQRYLDRACATQTSLLCPERSSLRADIDWFRWGATGPWMRHEPDWRRGDPTFLREARAIGRGTVREELPALVLSSLRNGATQLVTLGLHPNEHRSSPTVQGAMKSLRILEPYLDSRQVQRTLPVAGANVVQYTSAALGLVLLLWSLPRLRDPAHGRLRLLTATVCAGITINAFVTGGWRWSPIAIKAGGMARAAPGTGGDDPGRVREKGSD